MISTRLHVVSDTLLPMFIATLSQSSRRRPATRRIMLAGPVWHYDYTALTR